MPHDQHDLAASTAALRAEFGHTFTDLPGDQVALLAADVVDVWHERFVEFVPGHPSRAWTLTQAVTEFSRRLGGRRNLASYAATLAAGAARRSPV